MKRIASFTGTLAVLTIFATANYSYSAENDLAAIKTEVTKRHDEAVKRLSNWIKQVSIAGGGSRVSRGRGAHGAAGA
jgi:hypothetical protein